MSNVRDIKQGKTIQRHKKLCGALDPVDALTFDIIELINTQYADEMTNSNLALVLCNVLAAITRRALRSGERLHRNEIKMTEIYDFAHNHIIQTVIESRLISQE